MFTDFCWRIADTKSFRHSVGGKHNPSGNPLQPTNIIYTPGRVPPELHGNDISVDKAHAFILGRNILKALTNIDTKVMESLNTTAKMTQRVEDIDSPIFKNPSGQEYLKLLKDLWSSDPRNRISVSEAAERLEFIDQLTKQPESQQFLFIQNYWKFKEPFAKLQSYYTRKEHQEFIALQKIAMAQSEEEPSDVIKKCENKLLDHILDQLSQFNKEEIDDFIKKQRANFDASDDMALRASIIEKCADRLDFTKKCNAIFHRIQGNDRKFPEKIEQVLKDLYASDDSKATDSSLQKLHEIELEIEAEEKSFLDIIEKMKDLGFGDPDPKMEEYILNLEKQYYETTDKAKYIAQCQKTLIQMQNDPIESGIHQELARYLSKGTAARNTYVEKTATIIAAMKNIDVLHRGKIFSDDSNPEYLAAQKALAANRRQIMSGLAPVEIKEGKVVELSAAEAFRNLKTKYKSYMEQHREADPNVTDENTFRP